MCSMINTLPASAPLLICSHVDWEKDRRIFFLGTASPEMGMGQGRALSSVCTPTPPRVVCVELSSLVLVQSWLGAGREGLPGMGLLWVGAHLAKCDPTDQQ